MNGFCQARDHNGDGRTGSIAAERLWSRPARGLRRWWRATVAAALVLLQPMVFPVSAAQLTRVVVETANGAANYIQIENDIEVGDWSKFMRLVRANPDAAGVLLRSDGGSLDDGLAIAKHVFEHRLATMVTGTCHSVCAAIFLAGRDRYITPEARLTVHGAYKQLGDWVVEDDMANVTVAWFIGHMGYPLSLVRLWVSTPSDSDAPITLEMNARLKLGFTPIDAASTTVRRMEPRTTFYSRLQRDPQADR